MTTPTTTPTTTTTDAWETTHRWQERDTEANQSRPKETDTTQRLRVPGGWLYHREVRRAVGGPAGRTTGIQTSMVFVPDGGQP